MVNFPQRCHFLLNACRGYRPDAQNKNIMKILFFTLFLNKMRCVNIVYSIPKDVYTRKRVIKTPLVWARVEDRWRALG